MHNLIFPTLFYYRTLAGFHIFLSVSKRAEVVELHDDNGNVVRSPHAVGQLTHTLRHGLRAHALFFGMHKKRRNLARP